MTNPTHFVALKRGKSLTCPSLASALDKIEGITVHSPTTVNIVRISGAHDAIDRVRRWAGEDYRVEPILYHQLST